MANIRGAYLRALLSRPHRDGPIILPVLAICVLLLLLLASRGVNALQFNSYFTNLMLYLSVAGFLAIGWGARILWRDRPDRPIAYLVTCFRQQHGGRFIMAGLPMMLALAVFLPVFSAMKAAIPLFNSFEWDGTWIAWDHAIHGRDPWLWLQPVLGRPWVTFLLAGAYHLWILLLYVGGVFFCFMVRDRSVRNRYFISLFGIWLVCGVALATAFASVGPCFLEPLMGNRRFAAQMDYLYWADSQLPIMVLNVQERLLIWQFSDVHSLASGITAMPSMHIAMAFLFALAVRHLSRWAGYAFFAFLAVIMVGAVHLGYHYAVDGYLSLIVTAAIWRLSAVYDRWIRAGEAADPGAVA